MGTWIYTSDLNGICCTCQPEVCDSCFCTLNLNTAGGDAGYDVTYNTTGQFTSSKSISVTFEAFTVKDQLIIYANGSSILDTGCVSGTNYSSPTVPSGTTSVRVKVVPNCEGTTSTAWTLEIKC